MTNEILERGQSIQEFNFMIQTKVIKFFHS